MTRGFLTFVFALFLGLNVLIAQHTIIPHPVNLETVEGSVTVESEIGLVLDQENELISTMLDNFSSELKPLGIQMSSGGSAESTAATLLRITLKEEDSVKLGKEGYELHIGNGVINLQAIEPAGVFNGLQTFRQLLAADPMLLMKKGVMNRLYSKGCESLIILDLVGEGSCLTSVGTSSLWKR